MLKVFQVKRGDQFSFIVNFKNLNHWESFPHKYHKRRRAYIKPI